jgi:hypothetical protein
MNGQDKVDPIVPGISNTAGIPRKSKENIPRKPRVKKGKKRTLSEFKNWLEGIEEMQDTDWYPTKEQWNKIKLNLMAIIEEVIEVEVDTISTNTLRAPYSYPSGSPNNQNIDSTLEFQPVVKSQAKNLSVSDVQPDKFKQDIDTSNGNYESDFL